MLAEVLDRRLAPLFHPEEVAPPAKASELEVMRCPPAQARIFNEAWHSRLPLTGVGPWMLAYVAHYEWTAFGVALWNNPSARDLPQDWLELRRLAVPPDAPHCTASMMLGAMKRDIARHRNEIFRDRSVMGLLSYQDENVHTGTIYKAAGWTPAFRSPPRARNRQKQLPGYRRNLNGAAPDQAGKMRWELKL